MSLMTLNLRDTNRAIAIICNLKMRNIAKLSFPMGEKIFEALLDRAWELEAEAVWNDHCEHVADYHQMLCSMELDAIEARTHP